MSIGAACIYSGEHWPSNVLAGHLQGSIVVALTLLVYIHRPTENLIVAPALAPGRADAAYYYGLADDVYLFAPYVFSSDLLETAHGHNGRSSVQNYFSMIRFYVRLIERLDGLHLRHELEHLDGCASSGNLSLSDRPVRIALPHQFPLVLRHQRSLWQNRPGCQHSLRGQLRAR